MKRWVESCMVAYAPGQQGWQGWCSDLDVWIQNFVLLLLLSYPSGLVKRMKGIVQSLSAHFPLTWSHPHSIILKQWRKSSVQPPEVVW